MPTNPSWSTAITRYGSSRRLLTRARKQPFDVAAVGQVLVVTASTGRKRRITKGEWDRVIPLLDLAARVDLTAATFNSSYLQAIVDDLRR